MQISKISTSYVQKTNNNTKPNSNSLSNNHQASRSEVILKTVSNAPAINFKAGRIGTIDFLKFVERIQGNKCKADSGIFESFLENAKRIQKLTEQMQSEIEILKNSGDIEKTKLTKGVGFVSITDKDKQWRYFIKKNGKGTEVNYCTTIKNPDGDLGSDKIYFFKSSNQGALDCYKEYHTGNVQKGFSWYKFINDSDLNVLKCTPGKPLTVTKIRKGQITEDSPISGNYNDLFNKYIKPLEEVEL